MKAIESHQLKIPPTLVAFWEVIGAVNFVWDTELSQPAPILCADVNKTFPALDPLCADPPFEYMLDEIQEWREENEALHPIARQPYLLSLSADSSIKRGYSGPGPYGILLPFDGADPEFRMSNRKLPFIEYLREAVWMGGFPDLRKFKKNKSVRELLDRLTEGFIEF